MQVVRATGERITKDLDLVQIFAAESSELNKERFPAIGNLPSGVFFQFVPCPDTTHSPEFVHIPLDENGPPHSEETVTLMEWNLLWEAGHIRPQFFESRLPERLRWLDKYEGHNIYLIPRFPTNRYYAYSSLFHLLPQRTLRHFGLPLLRKGLWPNSYPDNRLGRFLPPNFDSLLEKAFAAHVWPIISPGSKLCAFGKSDPIKILAHNPDFWLPYIYKTIENRLKSLGRAEFDSDEQIKKFERLSQELPHGIKAARPLRGGTIWMGEEEAWEATKEMVDLADQNGRLRGIIDAIRSNRVEDDFSNCWSYAREDFERKLHRKRSRIKVTFVELDETIPVHGPESEIHEDLLWEDFLGLLDSREKRIVVCLRNGLTRVGEISKMLGYANHSPVSKALAKIRRKAINYLE